jgi:cysteine desulfuration protein SufE
MSSINDYIEAFDILGDWEARYAYLVELGEQLPPMPDSLKTDENRVKPCMSLVHVAPRLHSGKLHYAGDCDTAIIKGVLALLIDILSDKTIDEALASDVDALFKGLKLDEHLSPNRHVGVYAIVALMKQQAEGMRRAA